MTYENSIYYPTSYYPVYNQASMTPSRVAQQPAGFPAAMPSGPSYFVPTGTGQQTQTGTMEESFIENILRINHGKMGTFYFTYQGNNRWNSMVYHGRLETAGRDHIIISDPSSGKRYLLLMANLDWVEFGERINYPYPEINPAVQATLTTSD